MADHDYYIVPRERHGAFIKGDIGPFGSVKDANKAAITLQLNSWSVDEREKGWVRPVTRSLALKVGEKVRFENEKVNWTVRAVSPHFVVLTKNHFGDLRYTVIDWEKGIRGTTNLIGQGTTNGLDDEGCVKLLEAFERGASYSPEQLAAYVKGETSWSIGDPAVEISHRNHLKVVITHVQGIMSFFAVER